MKRIQHASFIISHKQGQSFRIKDVMVFICIRNSLLLQQFIEATRCQCNSREIVVVVSLCWHGLNSGYCWEK